MLDSTQQIRLPDYPQLVIYPDREAADRYYVFSQPRLAETDGISLLTYAKAGVAMGGQLSLTTSLGLTVEERAGVEAALCADDAPPARLLAPQWTGGNVTVRVGKQANDPVLTLTGTPSQLGDNRCALSASLSAEQAKAVGKLWRSSDPWLHIAYDTQFVGQDAAETTYQVLKNQRITLRQAEAHTVTQQLTNAVKPHGGEHTEVRL